MGHILLAHHVRSADDFQVVDKAIGVLLKGEGDASRFLQSEKYAAVRSSALADPPSESDVYFKNLKLSVIPSKNSLVKESTVTLSWMNNSEPESPNKTKIVGSKHWFSEEFGLEPDRAEELIAWHYTL
jgi:hypothetical protein